MLWELKIDPSEKRIKSHNSPEITNTITSSTCEEVSYPVAFAFDAHISLKSWKSVFPLRRKEMEIWHWERCKLPFAHNIPFWQMRRDRSPWQLLFLLFAGAWSYFPAVLSQDTTFNDQSRKVKNASWCRLVSIFTRRNETLMTQEQCISRRHTHTHTHTHTQLVYSHSNTLWNYLFTRVSFQPRTPSAPCRQKERKSKKKDQQSSSKLQTSEKRSPEIDCITNTD